MTDLGAQFFAASAIVLSVAGAIALFVEIRKDRRK